MASRDPSPPDYEATAIKWAIVPAAAAEPRSFLPVKTKPITVAKPTNAQLAHGINQLHLCHEDTKEKVEVIQRALGLTEGQKRVSGLSTPMRAFLRSTGATATAMGGLILLYRFAVSAWPSVWGFIQALNHVVLTGKF